MSRITPFLWFDGNGEEAMNFYVSAFDDSWVLGINRGPDGKVFTGSFELRGQEFMFVNAGPDFHFTEAISMFVKCETQDESTTSGTSSPPTVARSHDAAG